MSAVAAPPALGPAVLAHLDAQLDSARRLLRAVLAQGAAIRARDVEGVLARLTEVQAEMGRRGGLETERTALLTHAAARLGTTPADVTLERLTSLLTDAEAGVAQERSAELRGLLAEIAREHGVNRALMRQELAFLDHLTRLLGDEPAPAYGPGAAPPAPSATTRAFDLRA